MPAKTADNSAFTLGMKLYQCVWDEDLPRIAAFQTDPDQHVLNEGRVCNGRGLALNVSELYAGRHTLVQKFLTALENRNRTIRNAILDQHGCTRCGSLRLASVSAHSSDRNAFAIGDLDDHGYVPADMGVGEGDYLKIEYCLDCGQLQGTWPLPPTGLEQGERQHGDNDDEDDLDDEDEDDLDEIELDDDNIFNNNRLARPC